MKIRRLALGAAALTAITSTAQAEVKSIMPVHGAFADDSGWQQVAGILEYDGYSVRVVQIPETTFKDGVAATRIIKGVDCANEGSNNASQYLGRPTYRHFG
jgi:hypothetical protein